MNDYQYVLEKYSENSYGAYVPDLPGCVAVGKSEDVVIKLIKKAIKMHIKGMLEDGIPLPDPSQIEVLKKAS